MNWSHLVVQVCVFFSIWCDNSWFSLRRRWVGSMVVQLLFQLSDTLFMIQQLVPSRHLCQAGWKQRTLKTLLRPTRSGQWRGRKQRRGRVQGIHPATPLLKLQTPDQIKWRRLNNSTSRLYFGIASLDEKLGAIGREESEDILLFGIIWGAGSQGMMDTNNSCRSSIGARFLRTLSRLLSRLFPFASGLILI